LHPAILLIFVGRLVVSPACDPRAYHSNQPETHLALTTANLRPIRRWAKVSEVTRYGACST